MKKEPNNNVLVVFFSHTGENYAVGNIAKGNTCKVAEEIARQTGGRLFEVVPEKEYPKTYDACTEVAKHEKDAAARPSIKGDASVADCDTVFIGYPIWWSDLPMPLYTFIEKHQWEGKTVLPFCTHEGSGLADTERLLSEACKGAKVGRGLALKGTTAQNKPEEVQKAVRKWLGKAE